MAFLVPIAPLTPRHRFAPRLAPGVRVVRAEQLRQVREAKEVLALAHAQAQQMREKARVVYEEERRRGYAEGVAEALKESSRLLAEQSLQIEAQVAALQQPLVDVVTTALRRLVQDFDDRERVQHAVRNALALVRNRQHITLRVPPEQLAAVRDQAESLRAGYPGIHVLDVVPDAEVPADGCVLACDLGTVQSSLEAQLQALEEAMQSVSRAAAEMPSVQETLW